MKRRTLFFRNLVLIASCCLAQTQPAAAPHATATPEPKAPRKLQPAVSPARLEKAIHDLINRERRAQGLKPLAWDGPLGAVARGHSGDMAKRNYFSHNSPEGDTFGKRYRKARYRCALRIGNTIHLGAENIARGNLYASVRTVNGIKDFDWNSEEKIARTTVEGWMASPGHRANILAAHWKHEGIGLVVAPDQKVYITQNFC